MSPGFLEHLHRNWPLALIVAGLLIFLPVTLLRGVFYTNQGRILRSTEPERYRKWVLSFLALELACLAVLLGSYFFSAP
jgi:hypothetical protein